MKRGFVTFEKGEYILATKRGQYVIKEDNNGYYTTNEGSALSRNKVLLLNAEEAAKIAMETRGRLIPLDTTKLIMTYGIKYGDSGNYPVSPLVRALRAFDELEDEEISRFWQIEIKKIARVITKGWNNGDSEHE
ncbi:MAG: hypothetical protein ABF991_00355 [Liquorilactobacillus hordei]|uniref:hypothetical protein n=1 Tax=Liquorilactobacillus hordei TaxID=468911 RepID=UPI0039ECD165